MKNKWTVENIPDLTGKLIIVTGANSGLGFEAAKEFARKGAQIILACRNMNKTRDALNKIKEEIPAVKYDIMKLNLADLNSVHKFANEFKNKYKRLDVLLNNAGVMMTPELKTKDGFELQLGINHLGHFALTGLLLDILKKTKHSRVVNVSSSAHKFNNMEFDNMMFEKGDYSGIKSYGRSKLANLLFTYELQRRFDSSGIDSISVAAHPGVSNTNLGRYFKKRLFLRALMPLMYLFSQSASMGALPIIRAAVDPGVRGGDFYGPGGFMGMRGYPVKVKSNDASHNKKDSKVLWEVSEKLTKVRFNFKK